MVTFNDLKKEEKSLFVQFTGKGSATSELKVKIEDFIKKLGQKFMENNEIIAKNPTHPRVSILRKENSKISQMIKQWEKILNT